MNCVENLEGEIWRYIMDEKIGFYPYMVSNMGRVKSLNYNGTGDEKLLKQVTVKRGYLRVVLYRKGEKPRSFYVHRLVASMFIKNPDNLPFVNHKDENPSNNNIENLEWCTHQYNITYGTILERIKETQKTSAAWKEGRLKTGEKLSKKVYQYTIDNYTNNLKLVNTYSSTKEAARQTGYSQGNISTCCRGEKKSAYGFLWRYEPIEPSTETEKINLNLFPLSGVKFSSFISTS